MKTTRNRFYITLHRAGEKIEIKHAIAGWAAVTEIGECSPPPSILLTQSEP